MLSHRGPDDRGLLADGRAGLAMSRLSIIDIAGGHQPMVSPDREAMVVFNGEIYNHVELRIELESRGWRFRSQSDTEVVLAAYLEYGPGMVDRFNGMFAIAVWDFRGQTCHLYRDRFGKKPLYWAEHGGSIYFASEIKALLAVPSFPRELDHDALRQYLYLGQILPPRTALRRIQSLPPGHQMSVTAEGIRPSYAYWDIAIPSRTPEPADATKMSRYEEELDERLSEAVRIRLRSDVPVAATLSGGLDSTSVLYYLRRHSAQVSRAFTISFRDAKLDEDRNDESAFQKSALRWFGVESSEFSFFENREEIAEELPRATWIYESPDSVAQQEILFTFLSRDMRNLGYKVGLGGEGSDEMMRGYPWYDPSVSHMEALRPEGVLDDDRVTEEMKRRVRAESWFMERWGYPTFHIHEQMAWSRLQRLFDSGLLPPAFTDEERGGPDHADFSTHVPRERWAELRGMGLLQYADIKLRLPEFILGVQDKFTMAASVEMRCPFLDHTLASWLVQLPANMTWHRGREKCLMRRIMQGRIPREILRRRKQGFGAPLLQSDHGYNRARVRELTRPATIRQAGIISPAFIQRLRMEQAAHELAGRTPAAWQADLEVGFSVPELYLRRIEDIQNFWQIFIRDYESWRDDHLRRAVPVDRAA